MRAWRGILVGCEILCTALLGAGCNGSHAALPCDIHTRTCQQAIYDAVSTTRDGQPATAAATAPPVEFISRATLRDMLASNSSMTDTPASISVGLQLLDLLDPSTSLDQAATGEQGGTIQAFYVWSEKTIYVVDDPTASTEDALYTLAHEMTHAVQDADVDLESFEAAGSDTTDHNLAVHNLVEGEATHVAYVVTIQALYGNPRFVDWDGFYGQWTDDTLDYVASTASPYVALPALAYPVGARYLSDIWRWDGFNAVRALYGGFPRATVRWLDGSPPSAAAEPMDCAPPDAPPGFETSVNDVLGSYVVFACAAAEGVSRPAAWSLAHAWRGDRLVVSETPRAARPPSPGGCAGPLPPMPPPSPPCSTGRPPSAPVRCEPRVSRSSCRPATIRSSSTPGRLPSASHP